MSNKITFTTPIFYPSGKLHIGTATTVLIADILCKFNKTIGRDSQLLTGLDENSTKVVEYVNELRVKQPDLTVQIFLDNYANTFKDFLHQVDVNYDFFIRTSSKQHKRHVTHIWNQLYKKGLIYKGHYQGYYSVKDETFFSSKEVNNGFAPTGSPVQLIQQECYYFKASQFQDFILQSMKDKCYPGKTYNLLTSYMKNSLQDLCLSRQKNNKILHNCQITVPNDDNHIIYVWFDALLNYLHIGDRWNHNVVHIIAKDIAQFHGVFWPAILKSLDYKLFNTLLIHQWWILEDNKKISKSSANSDIDLQFLLQNYPIDFLRFCCFKNNLIGQDKQFNLQEVIIDFNSFVIDQFSNLVHRSWSLAYRNQISWETKQINNQYIQQIDQSSLSGHIDQVFYALTTWTQQLNKDFHNQQIWKHLNLLPDFMIEVEQLVKYWSCILTQAKNINWHIRPTKLYEKLL